jgi:hypothetical protein
MKKEFFVLLLSLSALNVFSQTNTNSESVLKDKNTGEVARFLTDIVYGDKCFEGNA